MIKNQEDSEFINSIAKRCISSNEIKINPEYEKIVPSLYVKEYDLLKSSIKESGGNVVPIIVNKQNEILDGHHRYRACLDLGLDPKVEVKEFSDSISEKEFVIVINLNRRQLNSFQISELGYQLEKIEKEKAKIRQIKHLKNVQVNESSLAPIGANDKEEEEEKEDEKGKTSKIIAKKTGQSTRTYERNKKIIEEGSDEQKEKLRQGKISTNKVYSEIIKSQKRDDLLSSISNNGKPLTVSSRYFPSQTDLHNVDIIDALNLLEGDFSERGEDIKSESIDLIFTDPPYSSKDLSIYHKLVILAKRVLKPGGSLVTYIGQHNLLEILNIVTSNDLKYWWTIAVKHTGSNIPFYQRKVHVMWKPLLWFVKGEKLSSTCPLGVMDNYLSDYIESKQPEKILDPWQQSGIEAEYVIKKLTLENQKVLDPMMGSGTTGIAALELKRRFIGIEIEHEKFLIAKNMLYNKTVTDDLSNSLP